MNGVELIAAERRRQREEEGWTNAHDDTHSGGELAVAAACYALPSGFRSRDVGGFRGMLPLVPHALWPWDAEWWKPVDGIDIAAERQPDTEYPALRKFDRCDARVRELVKAGALVAAEIDRLQRVGDAG